MGNRASKPPLINGSNSKDCCEKKTGQIHPKGKVSFVTPDFTKGNEYEQACSELLPMECYDYLYAKTKKNSKAILIWRMIFPNEMDYGTSRAFQEKFLQKADQNTFPIASIFKSKKIPMDKTLKGETIGKATGKIPFSALSRLKTFSHSFEENQGVHSFKPEKWEEDYEESEEENGWLKGNKTIVAYPTSPVPSSSKYHRWAARKCQSGMYKEIRPYLDFYKEHIWSLEYRVRGDIPGSLDLIRIINNFPNLRSLALCANDWGKEHLKKGLVNFSTTTEIVGNSLTHLQILGSNGLIPLNLLFGGKDAMGNGKKNNKVTSLCFSFVEAKKGDELSKKAKEGLIYAVVEIFPRLTRLKVDEVDEGLLDKVFPDKGQPFMALKYLSIKLKEGKSGLVGLLYGTNKIMKKIDKQFQETLESFEIEFSRPGRPNMLKEKMWRKNCNNINFELTKYSKMLKMNLDCKLLSLKYLKVPYLIYQVSPQFVEGFAVKFPNLKRLSFVSNEVLIEHFPDFHGFCKPFWIQFPESLEKITLNYWARSGSFQKLVDEIKQDYWELTMTIIGTKKETKSKFMKKKDNGMTPVPTSLTCFRPGTMNGLSWNISWIATSTVTSEAEA